MSASAVSSAGIYALGQSPLQSLAPHKHGGRHAQSIGGADAGNSNIASPATSNKKVGSAIDITV